MNKYTIEEKIEIINKINEMQKVIRKYKKEKNKEPNNEEIAKLMNKSIEEIIEIKEFIQLSDKELEELNIKNKDKYYSYTSSNEIKIVNEEEYNNIRNKIINNLDILNEREQKALSYRFAIDKDKNLTISEISKKLCISKKEVRMTLVKGLNIINNPKKIKEKRNTMKQIKDYMEL